MLTARWFWLLEGLLRGKIVNVAHGIPSCEGSSENNVIAGLVAVAAITPAGSSNTLVALA